MENENEFKDLTKEILALLKGKRASLCKNVLKHLIDDVIDGKSLVQ